MLETLSCAEGRVPPPPKFLVTDPVAYLGPDRLVVRPDGRTRIQTGLRHWLIAKLSAYRAVSKHEFIVWISDRPLGTEPIEQWCQVTFNAWGVGRAGYNDGLALFVFPSPPGDRLRMRLQVGRGLDQVLTDQEATRILRAYGPQMELGAHDEGIEGIVDAVISAVGEK